MKQRKRSITYDLSDDKALEKQSRIEGCSIVALIRRAIKNLLRDKK